MCSVIYIDPIVSQMYVYEIFFKRAGTLVSKNLGMLKRRLKRTMKSIARIVRRVEHQTTACKRKRRLSRSIGQGNGKIAILKVVQT